MRSAVPHPKIMGIIRESGGKMHMSEGMSFALLVFGHVTAKISRRIGRDLVNERDARLC